MRFARSDARLQVGVRVVLVLYQRRARSAVSMANRIVSLYRNARCRLVQGSTTVALEGVSGVE